MNEKLLLLHIARMEAVWLAKVIVPTSLLNQTVERLHQDASTRYVRLGRLLLSDLDGASLPTWGKWAFSRRLYLFRFVIADLVDDLFEQKRFARITRFEAETSQVFLLCTNRCTLLHINHSLGKLTSLYQILLVEGQRAECDFGAFVDFSLKTDGALQGKSQWFGRAES